MTKFFKRPLSILLTVLIVLSVFLIIPITTASAADVATVTVYDLNGVPHAKDFAVGDTVTVCITLDVHAYQNGEITSIDGTQTYTNAILELIDEVYPEENEDEMPEGYIVDCETMFPVLGDDVTANGGHTVSSTDETLGEISFNASKPNPKKAFLFDEADDVLILSHYRVKAAGSAEVRTTLTTLSRVENKIVDKGQLADGYSLTTQASFITYTVTWKDGADVIETDTDVSYGKIPSYDGPSLTKDKDNEYVYTLAGWNDGSTTYAPDALPAVTGDVTYTAVYEETPRISGHSISVAGDIGVNYYLSFTEEELDEGVSVEFDWTVNDKPKQFKVENLKTGGLVTDDGIKVSCPVPIAEMTYDIAVTITCNNGEKIEETYSVAAYAKQFLTDEEKAKYIAKHFDDHHPEQAEQDYNNIAYLVKTLLYYGARAQEHFDRDKDNLADKDITFGNEGTNPATEVDPEQIVTGASDMSAGLGAYGLEYKGSTVVFLSETSLRHYYEVVDETKFNAVKDGITFNGAKAELITKANGDTYFELKNIAAPNIDKLYTLHIGTTDYNYSVLAYIKAILETSKSETMKKLATATYWYNKAADVCFLN